MNTAIFRRLLWKEFRQQWAFWVAMVFLTTLLMVLLEVSFALFSVRPQETSFHLNYIFLLAVLYALGCGATLFAAEHDAGTYQFLRNLPVGGFSVFLSKIMLAIFATSSLACVLYFPTQLLAGYFYGRVAVLAWPVWCLGLGSALALGSFFSLLVKRPLLAAFLGGVVGLAGYLLVWNFMETWYSKKTPGYPVYSGMLVVLCLANAWLGRRWFSSRSSRVVRFAAKWGFGEAAFDASNAPKVFQNQNIGYWVHGQCLFPEPFHVEEIYGQIAFHELNTRTVRRATKIVLALEAWKLEHGELPKSLDDLVGPYFKMLPAPPREGDVFAYFPKGVPHTLWAYPPQAGNYGLYVLNTWIVRQGRCDCRQSRPSIAIRIYPAAARPRRTSRSARLST